MTCETKHKIEAPVQMVYKNWKGVTSTRQVIPISFRFGTTDWHPAPEWLMLAWDVAKNENREFSLNQCDFLNFSEEVTI